ncbi:MAG: T9SS type A sorting domain-containing protein [Saprospiraceae bacterium]
MKILLLLGFLFHTVLPAQNVVAGGRHSLAICSDSTVRAWGYNGFGQLGDGTMQEKHTGVPVPGLAGVAQVAGGLFHSLFVKSDGTVWSCGRNVLGPLGNGTNVNSPTVVPVTGLTDIVEAAGGGEHSLFVKNDGTVWACGANASGQLGDGTNVNKNTAVPVGGLVGIVQAAAGAEFSLFLKNDGTVWACGHNGYGQYGNGTNTSSKVPVQVPGLADIVQVSAGEWHSVFVKRDGTVFSAGRNQYGQLGDGTTTDKNTAAPVSTLSDIARAEAGGIHTVFVKKDGSAWACGLNSNGNNDGQLGDGTTIDRYFPVQVISSWGSKKIRHAEATREHSLFVTDDGQVWGSGRNNYGQLGAGVFSSTNATVPLSSSTVCTTLLVSSNAPEAMPTAGFVSPNPFSEQTTLRLGPDMDRVHLIVYNSAGQRVQQLDNVAGPSVVLYRDGLPDGLYFVQVRWERKIEVYKLVVAALE